MTRRLLSAGVRVIGYDARAGQAASVGAVAAESLGAVCDGTDLVLLSLPDSRVVESVVFGSRPEADGLLDFVLPGQAIVDLTSAPSSTQRSHAALAERGVEYLDAGISGGAAAADKGTLTTSNQMTKDVVAYVDHVRGLGVPCLNAAAPLAAFGAAANLGYGELISNRVVDAIGDLAGGVRLHDTDGPREGDAR